MIIVLIAAVLESSLDMLLVGPYDVLSRRLKGVPWEKCVLHSRHYYDPPEMVTVLEAVGDGDNGFHIGYFRYSPTSIIRTLNYLSPRAKQKVQVKVQK